MENITLIINSFILQDYIIIGISFFFWIFFLFLWIEKVYKSYLWIIIWLFVFSFINLALGSLNNQETSINWLIEFFVNNKDWLWIYSLFFIFIFAIFLPLNQNLFFRNSENKILNYFLSFIFWLVYLSFIISIILSIINNKFLFKIDENLIIKLKDKDFIKDFVSYFWTSVIYKLLSTYDSAINFFITIYIFYKMTIWWVIDYIFYRIFALLKAFFELQISKWSEKKEEHSDKSHSKPEKKEEHSHDDHWHEDDHWHKDEHHDNHGHH